MPEADRSNTERVLAELCGAIAADAGAALYLDDGEGSLHLVASVGNDPERPATSLRRLLGRSSAPADSGTTAMLSVPDVRGGVLCLARRGRDAFTTEDLAVARLYARQLAPDLNMHHGQSRSTLWTRQLETIQRIAAQLARLASLEDVGLAICQETKQVIDYDNCRVYVVEANGVDMRPVAFRSEHPDYAVETVDTLRCRVAEEGEGLTGYVAARGEPLLVRDASRDPRAVPVPGTRLDAESMLLVPMRYEGRVTGVIVLSKMGADQFHAEDMRLLQILSDQAAVAIENARLLDGREQLVSELAALLDISQTTAADESELAIILARKLASAARADACILSRWEEGSTLLRTVGSFGAGDLEAGYDILDRPTTRRVLRDGRPRVVQADDEADRAESAVLERMGAQTLLVVPLMTSNRPIGLIEFFHGRARPFTEYEMNSCLTMANQAGAVLENARLVDQLRRAADVDQVTGVNNHRYLQERLKQEVARSSRTRSPLSVLMIDLDGFKGVNDKHGHADGDRVLRGIAAGLKVAVRSNDIVARYGGDEFVVLMPDTSEEQARRVAERVVAGVRNRRHQLSDGTDVALSCSAGLAVYPEDGRTPAALLQAADAAMYVVKRAGGGDVRRIAHTARPTQVSATLTR